LLCYNALMKKCILLFVILVLLVFSTLVSACKTTGHSSELTILHTNDTHASLDNIGRRATLVKQVRDEVGKEDVMLLDGGDVFTGSLYFTMFKGQADLWFMQYLGYEAMCLGNHEFDKGPQILADFVSKADFPLVCANFDFSKEPALAGKIKPWTIIKKNNEQYGVIGLTSSDTNELSIPGDNIIINDCTQAAQKAVDALKKQGINKIIVLSHIGWQNDLDLARQVQDIDVIVGAHTHTVPDVYPTLVNASSAPTLVVQAGSQGKYLGRLNIDFDSKGVVKNWDNSRLITVDDKIEADPVCAAKLAEYKKPIQELLGTIIGQTQVDLDGDRNRVRSQETNLGNLTADAMLNQTRSLNASIAIINGGNIRTSVPSGDFSMGQVVEILPFGNYLVVIDISGRQITDALENGVSQVEQGAGRFPQVAGMRYTWDSQAAVGSRIISVEIKNGDGYVPLDPSATYSLATSDFLAGGGDGYTVFEEAAKYYNSGLVDYEVLKDYIKNNSPLNPSVEGRITKLGQ
jgi:5'-nucleotidase / UDP-sugar diphosphatase